MKITGFYPGKLISGTSYASFIMQTIFAYCNLRKNKFLVLCSAFSGVVAQLLPGGMTIHKRFRMGVDMPTDKFCNILRKSPTSETLKKF